MTPAERAALARAIQRIGFAVEGLINAVVLAIDPPAPAPADERPKPGPPR